MDITLERILSLLPKKDDGSFVRGAKKDFATSIGYDSGDIVSMWIKGSSSSYYGKLHEIAAKYNVSVEWLKGEDEKLNDKNIAIIETIRAIASQSGKNIDQIEQDCGFERGSVLKWAKDPKSPPYDMLFKIADYLFVQLEDLTGDEYEYLKPTDPNTKKSPALSSEGALGAELIKRLVQLTPDELEKVDAFVQGLLAAR